MLLTALKMGRTSHGPETFLHSGFTSVKGKRGRKSEQSERRGGRHLGQRGEKRKRRRFTFGFIYG